MSSVKRAMGMDLSHGGLVRLRLSEGALQGQALAS